jgi:hypothetical protein
VIEANHQAEVSLDLIVLFIIGGSSDTRTDVVDEGVSELIVHLLDHKVLRRLQSLLGRDCRQVPLELASHFFEDAHALLVPVVYLSEQREVVCGVLLQNVILNDHHLQLFHVEPSIHLNGALVHQVNDLTLLLELLAAVREVHTLVILNDCVGN